MAAPKDITSSKLFEQLDLLVGVDDIDEEDVTHLRSALLKIAKRADTEWGKIIVSFPQYTDHSVQHMVNILDLIYDFLPKKKAGKKEKIQINALELSLLIAAVLLHDVGMAVTPAEKEAAKNDPQYRQLRSKMNDRVEAAEKARRAGDKVTADAIDDAILVEFFRKQHAALSAAYIRKLEAPARLMFAEVDLHETLAQIAESHAWPVEHGRGDKAVLKLSEDERFGKTRVNVQFLAFCLRLADILDFDRSRTPQYLFKQINFTEEISIQEWKKHLSVSGWQIQKDKVSYRVACDSPETYVAVQEFLHWVDKELDAFHRAHRDWKGDDQDRYALNLAVKVDRDKVSMANKNHMAGDFRFALDYEKIMNLLMDRSLYPDPAMFLRELLQNSLDACRLQKARAQEENMGDKYRAVIQVYDHTEDPENPRVIFQDNGVGMSLDKVKNYFLQVGKSFYQSWEFRHEKELLEKKGIYLDACSRFGIGFLSCFLGGDKIEVQTYEYGSEPLKITIYGPDKYFLIEKLGKQDVSDRFNTPENVDLSEPQRYAGTKITVFLREGWRGEIRAYKEKPTSLDERNIQKGDVFDVLDFYAVNQEFPIHVINNGNQLLIKESRRDNDEAEIVFPSVAKDYRWSLKNIEEGHNKLQKLLYRHEIRFEKYHADFPGIRGRAWIWLLDMNGQVAPQIGGVGLHSYRGHETEGGIINESMAARFILTFWGGRRSEIQGKKLFGNLNRLKWGSDKELFKESVELAFRQVINFDFDFIKVLDGLNSMEKEERDQFLAFMAKLGQRLAYRQPYGESWMFDGATILFSCENKNIELAEYLATKPTHSWVDFASIQLRLGLRISLSGINLPSGIVDWSPMSPNSTRITHFLPPFVSASIDFLGEKSPIPAPHRLSCTRKSAEESIEKIFRVIIRELMAIFQLHQNEAHWRKWFKNYVDFFKNEAPRVLWKEMGCLQNHIEVRYAGEGAPYIFFTMAQILNEDKEHIPVIGLSTKGSGYIFEDLVIPESEVTEIEGIKYINLKSWKNKVGNWL